MIGYHRLSPGRGFKPVNAGLYYAQRMMAASSGVRSGVASALAWTISRSNRAARPRSVDVTETEMDAFRRQGYARLGLLLTPTQIAEVQDYLAGQKGVGGGNSGNFRLAERPKSVSLLSYDTDVILGCPHLLDLLNHPRILAFAEAYLGCRPTLSSWALRWSFPTDKPKGAQLFHRDNDDWRFFKLMVYLNDVEEDAGPHVFVAGSHLEAGSIRGHYFPDDQIAGRYEKDRIITFTGPAGTSFIVDTYGIHKGLAPTKAPRLMLLIQYSVLPNFSLAYEQPRRLAAKVDPYVNRLIVSPT